MPDAPGPLVTLARRLRGVRPCSLSMLCEILKGAEDYRDFVLIVEEFLPEAKDEVLGHPSPWEQVQAFASRFGDRYFPLADGYCEMVEGYEEITSQIPIPVFGLGWDDYDELASSARPGLQLMSYLIASPWEGFGERASLTEACREHVPLELLDRVPCGGLEPEQAQQVFEGSRFAGVWCWAAVLWQGTGSGFYDVDSEQAGCMMPLPWEREVVEDLTRQWQWGELINSAVIEVAEWIERDPPGHFGQIIQFMEERRQSEPSAGTGSAPVGAP